MSNLDTILGSKSATAIEVNGILVPANSLSSVLHGYCAPALMHNDVEGYSISKSGSLVRCKLGNRFFVITAAHNLIAGGYEHEQLCLHEPSRGKMITSARCIFGTDREHGEAAQDLRIYDFTSSVQEGALQKSNWLDLARMFPNEPPMMNQVLTCIGYPAEINSIDYDTPRYKAVALSVNGFATESKIRNRQAFQPTTNLRTRPSGMSGAPIFRVAIEEFTPKLYFEGVVTNANEAILHYTSAQYIEDFTEFL